jgi:3-oxoacyl-[acyl-carrier protein] reductase
METVESVREAFDLSGRTAVVTGAGSGLGRASAECLAGAGASVIVADLDRDAAVQVADALVAVGATARAIHANVADLSEHERLAASALDLGGSLDIWVNSAGIMAEDKVLDLQESDLDDLIAVNLKGTLFGAQVAGRHMATAGGGSIINMASAAMLQPSPRVAAYAMTKAAVVQLTRIMALETGKLGIRVNAIAPGFVPTKMTSRYYVRPDGTEDEVMKQAVLEPMAKFAPLKRVGTPSDIAFAVLYLAADASSFVTGQVLSPNGGMAMH